MTIESELAQAVRELRAALARQWADPQPCSWAQCVSRDSAVRSARAYLLQILQRS
jgi:hypothetical protein